MKLFKSPLVLVLIAMFTLSSCSYRLVDFTIISSKNHNLSIDKSLGVRVSGSSNGFLGIGVSIKDAMDNALQKAGPDYDLIIDGVIRVNDFFLVSGYKVTGTAISSRRLKESLGLQGYNDWYNSNNVFDPAKYVAEE